MDEERTITLMDLGSSPDPLIDPVLSPPMMPPSHIKRKSQAAERLHTVLAPSPRKQTFELDVGNGGSPQRLLVTVEAEDDRTRSTSRRLFQSPTPKRRATPRKAATITTTVPLRGLSDDEGAAENNATPRRRGRPRKSGTPRPTTRRKRQGTPARSRMSVSPQKDILTSDIGFETTPRASSPTKRKRKAASPVKDDGAPASQPRKRGRPRKQTMTSDDMAARLEQGVTDALKGAAPAASAFAHDEARQSQPRPGKDMEEDIWLANMSDQPTPVARRQHRFQQSERLEAGLPAFEPEPQLPRAEPDYQHDYDWPDMGGGADSYSEAGSLASGDFGGEDREDTIMAGEEFTMISIGSLPSMQPNSSVMAPQHQEDMGEATSLIINGALEYLRQSQTKATAGEAATEPALTAGNAAAGTANVFEDDVAQQHSEPEHSLPPPQSPQILRRSPRRTKAQPLAKQLARKTFQQEVRESPASGQPASENVEPQDASAYDDSFSDIPEAVLVAATPRRYRRPQPPVEEAAAEDIQPSIERPSRVNHLNPQSETNRLLTPDETPSPVPSETEDAQPNPPSPAPDVDMSSSPPIASPPQDTRNAVAHHIRRNSTETPADQLSSFTSSHGGTRAAPSVHLPAPEPLHRPSLSPIVRAGRALQLITSDPPSPPGRDSLLRSPFRGSVPKSSASPAPVLGQRPRSAARATRSPSQPRPESATQSPRRSWLAPLSHMKDFIVRSAQSLSPARVSVSGADRMDDPFGPDPGELTGSGSVRSTLFSGPSKLGQDRDATVSVASSAAASPVRNDGDDDAMSWQEDGSPAGGPEQSASPGPEESAPRDLTDVGIDRVMDSRGVTRLPEPATERSISPAWVDEGEQAEVDAEEQEEAVEEEVVEEEEDDGDIWLDLEAKRPTPHAPRNAPLRQEPAIEPPRRGKIPSPWRQNSRRLIYSDELEQYSDEAAPTDNGAPAVEEDEPSVIGPSRGTRLPAASQRIVPPNEEEEYSLLAPGREQRAPAPLKPPATRRPDLSTFFSSPATLPDMQEAPVPGLPMPVASQQANPAQPKARTFPVQRPQPSGNAMFSRYVRSQAQTQLPSVPQKQLEIGNRQRSVDLFSPVRRTVESASPEQGPVWSSGSVSLAASHESRPAHNQGIDSTPSQRQPENTEREAAPVLRTATPERAEQKSGFDHISQKQNFTPRQRQASSTLFQAEPVAPANSLFGNSQASAFFSHSRPQTQPPAHRRQEQESEEEDSSQVASAPKHLPDRAASPGKSCIRSPLKPKTPGRVVEFTSSTLSPVAQAQARAERRASASPEKRQDGGGAHRRSSVISVDDDRDKENTPTDDSPEPEPAADSEEELPRPPRLTAPPFTTRPPTTITTTTQPKPKHPTPTTPSLRPSTTNWTRAHWLRLDELLQARRLGTLQLQLELARRPSSSPAARSAPTTTAGGGTSSRHLLGKVVSSQGESLALEAWHLDVVDAFQSEVARASGGGQAGWDEVVLAKRVFALLVGEERRRLGLVPPRRGDEGGLGAGVGQGVGIGGVRVGV